MWVEVGVVCGGLTKHRFMEVKCWNMGHHDFLPKSFCVDEEDESSNWVQVDLASDRLGKNPLG